MDISDLPDMHQDFLTRTAESWARLSAAWTDALKSLREDAILSDRGTVVSGWMNPWAFQNIVKSPSTVSRLQEMFDSAARDLPELLIHGTDKRTVNRIKDKWLRSYRNLVGEMLGIPQRSEAQNVLDRWRTFAGAFPGIGSGFQGGLFPDFSAMMSAMKLIPESRSGLSGFDTWVASYNKMLDRLFRSSGGSLASHRQERFDRAMDAQNRFFDALPEFQEQIVSAAGRGLEKVIAQVLSLGVTQMSPEIYHEFFRVWISAHEEAMVKLFRSESFGRAIINTIRRGIDAKTEMENLMDSGLSSWSIPSKRDIEAVNEEVRALRYQVGRLEEEIQALKVELSRRKEIGGNALKGSEVVQQGLD